MEAKPRDIEHYETADGRCPFEEWMEAVERQKIHGIIMTRLDRVKKGNLGDCAPVGHGVSELRIHYGTGYRVYFGQDGDKVILLCAGIKSAQQQCIKAAIEYWRDYNA